jgi:hypothetical protein
VIGNSITLKEVLAHLDAGLPFSMMVITCNKQQETGGEELDIPKAWKHQHLTYTMRKALLKSQPRQQGVRKNPHHYANSTRNIKLPIGDIITIHIRLIRKFNGKTVL